MQTKFQKIDDCLMDQHIGLMTFFHRKLKKYYVALSTMRTMILTKKMSKHQVTTIVTMILIETFLFLKLSF